MFKHCRARVRAWLKSLKSNKPVAVERRIGPRVQVHLIRAQRKAENARARG